MRVFFATFPDAKARAELSELQWRLLEPLPGWRRTRAESLHLTLHFIGERSEPEVEDLIARTSGRPISLSGELVSTRLVLLPSARRPQVLALEFAQDSALTTLAASLRALAPTKDAKRAFLPHVTLARSASITERQLPSLDRSIATIQLGISGFGLYASERSASSAPTSYRLLHLWK